MHTTDTTHDYVKRLEAHLQMMSQRMESLQAELAAVSQRNMELEGGRDRDRAERDREAAEARSVEQEAMRRAEEIVGDTERRVTAAIAATQQRAAEIEGQARQRADQMLGSVNTKLTQLEREAADRLRDAHQRLGTPVDLDAVKAEAELGSAMEAEGLRRQVNELLQLRESVLLSIRQTVDGFSYQLSELEQAPLLIESPGGRTEPQAPSAAGDSGRSGIEVTVESITDFELASSLELGFAAIPGAGDARLKSLEAGSALLTVAGLTADQLAAGIAAKFPGAAVAAEQDGGLRVQLQPGSVEAAVPPEEESADAPEPEPPEADET